MALLTANDVLTKKFQTTKFREGYDQDEVDDFLDEVVRTLQAVYRENEELKGQLAQAQQQLQQAPAAAAPAFDRPAAEPEQTFAPVEAPAPAPTRMSVTEQAAAEEQSQQNLRALRESTPEDATTLISLAQRLHDEYVRAGQEEGEKILSEAKSQAQQIVREAEDTAASALGELEKERAVLSRKIDELRIFERDYRTRLQAYLENLLMDLEGKGSQAPQGGPAQGSWEPSTRAGAQQGQQPGQSSYQPFGI